MIKSDEILNKVKELVGDEYEVGHMELQTYIDKELYLVNMNIKIRLRERENGTKSIKT